MICPTEHDEQTALVARCALYAIRYPALAMLAAVPNGGARHPATALKLKREGVRAGYPDLQLLVARPPCNGLLIELKRRAGGTVRAEQTCWHQALRAQGYRVEVCRGADAAWAAICDYLGIGDADASDAPRRTRGGAPCS